MKPQNGGRQARHWCLLCLAFLVFSGCAGSVKTRVNAFKSESMPAPSGSIAVLPMRDELSTSLEFSLYQKVLMQRLQEVGYSPVANQDEAQWLALLDYSVAAAGDGDERRKTIYVEERAGLRLGSRAGGMVMDETSFTLYRREVNLVIAHNDAQRSRVYEVSASSEGRCSVMSAVFEPILESILRRFPAENGAIYKESVPGSERCQ